MVEKYKILCCSSIALIIIVSVVGLILSCVNLKHYSSYYVPMMIGIFVAFLIFGIVLFYVNYSDKQYYAASNLYKNIIFDDDAVYDEQKVSIMPSLLVDTGNYGTIDQSTLSEVNNPLYDSIKDSRDSINLLLGVGALYSIIDEKINDDCSSMECDNLKIEMAEKIAEFTEIRKNQKKALIKN